MILCFQGVAVEVISNVYIFMCVFAHLFFGILSELDLLNFTNIIANIQEWQYVGSRCCVQHGGLHYETPKGMLLSLLLFTLDTCNRGLYQMFTSHPHYMRVLGLLGPSSIFPTTWSNSPTSGDQLTLHSSLYLSRRSTDRRPNIDLWPKVGWYQGHLGKTSLLTFRCFSLVISAGSPLSL